MTYYLIVDKWPLYYKKDDQFIPLGNFEVKPRDASTHIVSRSLTTSEALKFLDESSGYTNPFSKDHRIVALDFIQKHMFYEELLDGK